MKQLILKFESICLAWFVSLSLVLGVTGFIAYVVENGLGAQIASLLHPLFGILFSVIAIVYVILHFRRIFGIRRIGIFSSGLLSMLFTLVIIYSGWKLLLSGMREDNLSIQQLHVLSATFMLLVVVIHVVAHVVFFPPRRQLEPSKFKTIAKLSQALVMGVGTSALIAVVLIASHYVSEQPYSNEPAVADYQYNYGQHPFRPSQTETVNNQFIDQRALMTTNKCIDCHQDIGAQWFQSAHRQAASDKTYETNVTLLATKKGIDATRYCEGCHAPLALLTGQLSEGGLHGGIDDSPANLEGVNCQVCHGIDQVVNTKGVASYRFAINNPYLFETADSPLFKKINQLAIQLNPRQHKSDMAAPELSTSKYCATCHAQFIDKELNGWGWVKMQDDYSAWLDGPYSGRQDSQFAHTNEMRCQDCHMPHVPSADPAANSAGMIRDHRFLAANTMLATLANDTDFLSATQRFLRSNKVRISIEPPHQQNATTNQMPVNQALRKAAIKPYYLYKGDEAEISLLVTNSGVGHNFPGGTIDINEVWIGFQVVDAEGQAIYTSGNIDEQDFLDEDAYQYRSLPTDRQGQVVWRHDLFNMVGKASVNIIKAGESDIVKYRFKIPYWAKGPISLTAQVRYRKLNTRYARWALKDEYQTLPITDMARAYLQVPIREKAEASDNLSAKLISAK